jgi:quaternary ammonium compound-resistance protein SugE
MEFHVAWFMLFIAGGLEVTWLIALKRSVTFVQHAPVYGAISVVLAWLSFALLSVALRTIPAGTAYAVWTGIGAAGGAVAGMLIFGESRAAVRLVSVGLIVAGIVGVKLAR